MYLNKPSVYSLLSEEWGNNAQNNPMKYVKQYTKEQIFEALDRVKEMGREAENSKDMGLFLIDILSVQMNNGEGKEKESLTILEQYYRYLWKAKKFYEEFLERNTKLGRLELSRGKFQSKRSKEFGKKSAEKNADLKDKRLNLHTEIMKTKKQHDASWSVYIHACEELEKCHNYLKKKFGMVDE